MMRENYFFVVDVWMIEMPGLQEAVANDYDYIGQSQMLHNI